MSPKSDCHVEAIADAIRDTFAAIDELVRLQMQMLADQRALTRALNDLNAGAQAIRRAADEVVEQLRSACDDVRVLGEQARSMARVPVPSVAVLFTPEQEERLEAAVRSLDASSLPTC